MIADLLAQFSASRSGRVDRGNYLLEAFGAGAPFFRAAQRAFMAAASLALPSGVNPPFLPLDFFGAEAAVTLAVPFCLAQRARVAAAIFARLAADIFRRPFAGFTAWSSSPPKRPPNRLCSASICLRMESASSSVWMGCSQKDLDVAMVGS